MSNSEGVRPYAVLVVGMHRSGTSAVTSELGDLGLCLPCPGDLLGAGYGNEAGHFESRSLMAVSDEILSLLGGSWDDPPVITGSESEAETLRRPLLVAEAVFEDAFRAPDRPVCWKDPRTTLLLRLWRKVLQRPIAVALCVRHPMAVARSLRERDGTDVVSALALWERYYRSCLPAMNGLPVFVTDYDACLDDPATWRAGVAAWVSDLGVTQQPVRESGATAPRLDPALRRHQDRAGPVLSSQLALYAELLALVGPHESFEHHPSSAESPWTTSLLDHRRDGRRLWRAAAWLGSELDLQVHPPAPIAPAIPTSVQILNAAEDTPAYHAWLTSRGEQVQLDTGRRAMLPGSGEAASPLFSIIVPCYRPPLWALECCVASVAEQSLADWQLCICDDGSADAVLAARLSELAAADDRIRVTVRGANGGIAAATNDALALATGEFVVLLDHDDELHPLALEKFAAALAQHPHADIAYSDEDKIDSNGIRHTPSFKPDWSPDLLTSNAYMCHALVARRSLLQRLGGLRSEFDGAQDYDLMLRATEVSEAVVHVAEILYHWRTLPGSASGDANAKPWAFEAGRRALEEASRRRHIEASVSHVPGVPGSYVLRRKARGTALVSAIVPLRDEPALTAACYRSFVESPGYDNFEILFVDNDSALPETRALLEEMARDHRVRLVEAPGEFDFVRINNAAVEKARGDMLLFLNNDIEARSERWLEAMVAQAERPEVGAVGARLLYPDGTIQHAGVVVGLGWAASHVQQGMPAACPGYLSLAAVTRNFSAVTGACMMTRRAVFEEVGGFDSNLPIAFNDIDYCLRLRAAGLLVVYTPLAELVHHESKSRGHSDDSRELPYFRQRWREIMLDGDPYYNPNLGRFDNNCRLPDEGDEARWEIFRSMLDKSSTS